MAVRKAEEEDLWPSVDSKSEVRGQECSSLEQNGKKKKESRRKNKTKTQRYSTGGPLRNLQKSPRHKCYLGGLISKDVCGHWFTLMESTHVHLKELSVTSVPLTGGVSLWETQLKVTNAVTRTWKNIQRTLHWYPKFLLCTDAIISIVS